MVDDKDDEKEAKTEEAPKSKKKLIIIIVAVLVVVLIAGGVGGYLFLSKGKHGGKSEGKKAETKTEKPEKGEKGGEVKEGGPMMPLEPFVVNLSDTEQTRYLKVIIQLELPTEELNAEVTSKIPQIRDEIIMLLSSKSYDDLSTAPGKRSLKRAILDSVNRYLTTGKVSNVYFSDFVIQ
jgi:flagellar FliL protein